METVACVFAKSNSVQSASYLFTLLRFPIEMSSKCNCNSVKNLYQMANTWLEVRGVDVDLLQNQR